MTGQEHRRESDPPYVDPTENVISLVGAAIKRQDDLREQESAWQKYTAELRATHGKELREIETARLDAIRAVDVGAVQRAAEVQATQAGALAAQVLATADAFRVSLAAALEPIQKDIRDLRDSQSRVTGGKEQVVETRDVRGESRLNTGQILQAVAVLAAILTLIVLYATKK